MKNRVFNISPKNADFSLPIKPKNNAHAEPEGRGESGAHRAQRIGNRPQPIGRRTPFKPSICLATISQVFAFL
jgi:hypothetical protein